jgi:hypothetical protein
VAMRGTRDRVRRSACAAVLASSTVLLAACGSADDEVAGPGAVSPAAATEEAPEPSPAPTPAGDTGGTTASDDLAGRLLPAEAFGADAEVVRLDDEHLGHDGRHGGRGWVRAGGDDHDGDGDDHDGWLDEVTVTPSACGDVLGALPMPSEDGSDPAVAAQAAHTDAVHSRQVVAEAPGLEGLALPVEELLAACSSVTVDGPGGWDATVQLAPVQVPVVGQDSGALQVTVTVAGWGGERTALVGIAVDGSRGMLLTQTAEPGGAAPDAAAFAALFEQAGAAAFE